MEIFVSLLIFGTAVYLFFLTNNKIKNIKENIIIDDSKKELEGLITEFNSAAARNIELIEGKINELQEIMKKANNKILQLDEKIDRANKPIVIEKLVEKKTAAKQDKKHKEESARAPNIGIRINDLKQRASKTNIPHGNEAERYTDAAPSLMKEGVKEGQDRKINKEEIFPKNALYEHIEESETVNLDELPRSERLKTLIKRGKTKEELLSLGFLENEINLLSFLIGKNNLKDR